MPGGGGRRVGLWIHDLASLAFYLVFKKNMLLYLLSHKFAQQDEKPKDGERRYALKNSIDVTGIVLGSIHLVILVLAVVLAYVCNKRSGKNNPILVAIVAFFFPEIYLLQAGIRSLALNDYGCAATGPVSPLGGLRTPEINAVYQ